MPSYVTPKINTAYVFYVSLVSQADTKVMQANPTLAAGDVKVATDDAGPANLATLPAVDADFTKRLKVSLSTGEMNGDNVTVIFSDAAGAEWCDLTINIQTTATQIDNLVRSTTPANTLDVEAGGCAGIDWGNVANKTTANDLSATDIQLADTVTTLTGHTAQTGDSYARLGAPAGASIAADLLAIDNFVDELETRLTAARAGYLDELGATNIPADIDTLLTRLSAANAQAIADWINGGRLDLILDIIATDVVNIDGAAMRGTDSASLAATALSDAVWTNAKAAFLDAAITGRAPASEYDTEMARITGNVALASGVDLTHIMGTILTEGGAGRLAASLIKLLDVATPLLVASDVMRGTDGANTTVPDAAGTAPTAAEIQAEMEENGASILDTLRDDLIDGGRLDLLIDGIKANTDNLPADPASETNIDANETKLDIIAGYLDTEIGDIITHLTDIKGVGWTDENLTTIDGLIDTLISRLTAARAGYLDKLNIGAETIAHTGNAANFKSTGFSTHNAAAVKTAIEAAGSHLALIKVVTDALTASAAAKLALSGGTIVSAAAAAGTLSTTQMTTNLTETTENHYQGRIIIWTSGNLQNQATDITAYDGTSKMLTFTGVTEAPIDGDAFVIV